jgi:hypothetical protein
VLGSVNLTSAAWCPSRWPQSSKKIGWTSVSFKRRPELPYRFTGLWSCRIGGSVTATKGCDVLWLRNLTTNVAQGATTTFRKNYEESWIILNDLGITHFFFWSSSWSWEAKNEMAVSTSLFDKPISFSQYLPIHVYLGYLGGRQSTGKRTNAKKLRGITPRPETGEIEIQISCASSYHLGVVVAQQKVCTNVVSRRQTLQQYDTRTSGVEVCYLTRGSDRSALLLCNCGLWIFNQNRWFHCFYL